MIDTTHTLCKSSRHFSSKRTNFAFSFFDLFGIFFLYRLKRYIPRHLLVIAKRLERNAEGEKRKDVANKRRGRNYMTSSRPR